MPTWFPYSVLIHCLDLAACNSPLGPLGRMFSAVFDKAGAASHLGGRGCVTSDQRD